MKKINQYKLLVAFAYCLVGHLAIIGGLTPIPYEVTDEEANRGWCGCRWFYYEPCQTSFSGGYPCK